MKELFKVPPGKHHPTDSDIRTKCFACKQKQNLKQATISSENGDTVYKCHKCGDLLVVISKEPSEIWASPVPGGGYRLTKDCCVRIRAELVWKTAEMVAMMTLPGHPEACTRKPDSEPAE